jgi:phenylalanyl-tRNA synthetase alpha chain
MAYEHEEIAKAAAKLQQKFKQLDDKRQILRAPELTALYEQIKALPVERRASFGKEVNRLKAELEKMSDATEGKTSADVEALDVTAPFDINTPPENRPNLLPAQNGSVHPLNQELSKVLDIFYRMGFMTVESREIDNDYYMFTSLNFPPGHPARDEYDTFLTDDGFIAPAHTSIMQNRVLRAGKPPIRAVIPGRVFRNEDLDARHEHTFYQLEGVYVDEGINAGHLIATLKTFLEEYFGQDLEVKTQPFYLPFTEPSFEFAI